MLRRYPVASAYLFALVLWGVLALQLRAEPVAEVAAPVHFSATVR
jgi:hypothetical protein